MDDKDALRQFLANENYMAKMHNLSWKALNSLFFFFLNQILGKGHIDNTDIENIFYCFGTVFVRKNMSSFKMFRQEALKVSKIYMLEKIIKVAGEKCDVSHSAGKKKSGAGGDRLAKMNEAFINNMTRCLHALKTIQRATNRRTSTVAGLPGGGRRGSHIQEIAKSNRNDNKFANVLKKLDMSATAEGLFNDSLSYLLIKFGTELQDNILLDRLAERIAVNYFKTAKRIGKLDLSEIDPLVGDTSCQIRSTVVASMPIIAQAAKDITDFDHNQVDQETKIFLGKCLMLTQKIPEEDTLENIVSTIRQQTPTYLPVEWCKQLLIREGNVRDAKRVFIKLKRDVARESLNRLETLVKSLELSPIRNQLIDVLGSSKREKSSLGIEMAPLFVTAMAMMEICKERQIPICFHVLNAMFVDDNIELVKFDLIFYTYNRKNDRFEKCPYHLESSKPVITIKNIWYEGSEPSLNYGEDFMDRLFNMENYVETWKAHPELSSRMVDLREQFLSSICQIKKPGFEFPNCLEYLKLKEELSSQTDPIEALGKVKRSSFIFVSHVYPSTVGVEKKLSLDLNAMDWDPCEIEIKPVKVAENKFHNKRYWEKSSKLDAVPMPGPTRKLSLQLRITDVIPSYRKHSLMSKGIIEEQEEEEL